MYHFKLWHMTGKAFGPDGMSQRVKQDSDEEYPPNDDLDEINEPPVLIMAEETPPLLKLEEFKDQIDTREGYLQV